MDRSRAERISARTALIVGFAVTIGLWAYTGFAASHQLADVKTEAAVVTARYDEGQQLLATVRTQLLLSSVRVRDALLLESATAIAENQEEMEESFHLIGMAIEDYEPVAPSGIGELQIRTLRGELAQFYEACTSVFALAPGRSRAAVRELLNGKVMPRREAVLHISDEIQTLNRKAYIGYQAQIARIYEAAERRSQRQFGTAVALSLGILLLIGLYAAGLDSRLQMQLKRDVRLSRELYDVGTQLIEARAEVSRSLPAKPPTHDTLD